jgi:glycosyltransferase involved in cell wall biosynthesis
MRITVMKHSHYLLKLYKSLIFSSVLRLVMGLLVVPLHGVDTCATDMPKVLIVASGFPIASQMAVLNQIIGLQNFGFDVHIYALHNRREHCFDKELTTHNLLKKISYVTIPPDIETFDFIIIQWATLTEQFLQKTNGLLKKSAQLLICLRGIDASVDLYKYPDVLKNLLRSDALILPVCDYFKQRIVQHGVDPNRIFVMHSTIDCTKFNVRRRIPDKKIHIMTYGRFVEKKGIEYAIQAIAKLINEKKHDIEFSIIGKGPSKKLYEQLIIAHGLSEHVKIYSWDQQSALVKKLENTHIFVLPSATSSKGDQEGIPNSLKEAMAMGIPVVSTYHAGIPELVEDGISGFLVPEKNVEALANKIEHLINHPEIWSQMGRNGRSKIERNFEINKENDKLKQILLKFFQRNKCNTKHLSN